MMVRLLYDPQFLHTLCGITGLPQVGHTARLGTLIFQLALRLSRLALEVLFFGHMDIASTSLFTHNMTAHEPYFASILIRSLFVKKKLLKYDYFFSSGATPLTSIK